LQDRESPTRRVFRKGGKSPPYLSRQEGLCVGGWGCCSEVVGRSVPTARLSVGVTGAVRVMSFADGQAA
jgi:hypothetical protein